MFTTCSGLYLFADMIGSPSQVNSLSFHLVQKTPVMSLAYHKEDPELMGLC